LHPLVTFRKENTPMLHFTRKASLPVAAMMAATALAFAAPAPARAADIVQTAIKAGQFKTLVAALKAAGLVATLKGHGPFTVFAPTDAAFAKLPHGTVAMLLKPANKSKLVKILTYHVIAGAAVSAKQAMAMTSPTSPPTVEGATLQIKTVHGKVMVNNATVVKADVKASNGVIHAINTVLMPPSN